MLQNPDSTPEDIKKLSLPTEGPELKSGAEEPEDPSASTPASLISKNISTINQIQGRI